MDGGEITDDVRTITRNMGGKFGGELGLKLIPVKLSFGADASKFSSRQFKIRQTAYVATEKVIRGIKKDRSGTNINEREVREGMVIEFDVFLDRLRKSPAAESLAPAHWWERRQEAKDPRIAYVRMYSRCQDMVVKALGMKKDGADTTLILALSPQWLLRPEEFSRQATIVGKLVGVKRDGESATDTGDGILDFTWTDNGSQDVVQRPSDPPGRPGGKDRKWSWLPRPFSKHKREVATAPAIPPPAEPAGPEPGRPKPSQATIRVVPIVIYK
jgi:hypothetical protein